ncbi:EspA/EspE family type VII secretion system effector [Mycobacterium sp. PS03-16]|uniref:TPR repeat region-containing protein n=1 Tax=Mycobacterium sp. PS03-16 TaxID=2559611 RepID=UPI001431F1AA|nr:EspA/EspE family type VII secretion system effector [Mycobacterium sp. PS03-16]
MSAIDGFNANWNNARETFGQGNPQPGTDFDNSSRLTGLGSGLSDAAPGSKWSGAAAANYDKANTDHQAVFTQLAVLDRKIAAQVDQSAQVVETGRQNLDNVRQWVNDAVNSLPPGKQRDQMELQIAKAGLGRLTEVVEQTNKQSNAIGQNIGNITSEYDSLKETIRFASETKEGEPKDQPLGITDDDEQGEDGLPEDEVQQDAKETVEGALSGNGQDATKVNEVLNSFTDAQIAGTEPLTAQQQQFLSQMQSQTANKSLEELENIRQSLGDNKGILANSWQLMSDPDVKFPKSGTPTDLFPEITPETVSGSMDHLPQSIQDVLKSPAWVDVPNSEGYGLYELPTKDQLQAISAMVADGDERFQQGSYLDGGLMSRGAEILQQSEQLKVEMGDYSDADAVVQDIFRSAGRDEFVAHELLTGKPFDGGPDLVTGVEEGEAFLDNMNKHGWADDGSAARTLTDWIDDGSRMDGTGHDQMAGEAAHAVASYLGAHQEELANMGSFTGIGLGAVNPELVRGYAEALAPYQEAMIGDHREPTPGFGLLEGEPKNYDTARNAFAVIHSDPEASRTFTEHAYQSILAYQQETADAAASGAPANGEATGNAGRMLGVLNSAATLAEVDPEFDMREAALGAVIDEVGGKFPIVGSLGADYIKESILAGSFDYKVESHDFKSMNDMQTYAVAAGLYSQNVPAVPQLGPFIDTSDGTLKMPHEVPADQHEAYYQALTDYTASDPRWGSVIDSFADEYDQGAGARR